MRSRPRWFVAASLLTYVTLTQGEAPVSVRLRYSATPGCPTHAEFVEAVRGRTPLARFGEEAGAWEVTVSAQSSSRTSTGVLSGQGSVPREVSAKSCADVISALALILALAIDPQAGAAGAASTSTGALPSASAAPSAVAAVAASASAAPPPEPRPASPRETPATEPPSSAQASAEVFWGFGAGAGGSYPFTSSWVSFLGPAASLELGARWTPLLSPSLRLTGALDSGSAETESSASAAFQLARVRLDLRPIRLDLAPPLSAVPYLGVEVGRLTGEGETGGVITEAQSESRDWLALAQGMAFELVLVEPVFLTISGEIREPLRRYRFVFKTPDTAVADVPAVEFGWSAGAAARFW